MIENRKSRTPWLFAGAVLLGICGLVIAECCRTVIEANYAADYSAHAALTKEICTQLAAVPPGERFPASLQDLHLSYPDGGDAKMLERFEYRSTGSQCTLKTVFVMSNGDRKEVVRTYPGGSVWPDEQ